MKFIFLLARGLSLCLVFATVATGFDAFDTHDVPTEAELLYIDITSTILDEAPQETSSYPSTGGDTSANPHGQTTPQTDHLTQRVMSHPHVKVNKGLPGHVSANLVCRGVPVNLELHHYYETGNGDVSDTVMRNDLNDMLNSQTAGTGGSQNTVSSGSGQIPVFSRGPSSDTPVVQDDFPRLYTTSCRTLRDYNNQAYFLIIEDPEYSSYKFVGSFVMGGDRYFIEPYASPNTSNMNSGGFGASRSSSEMMRAHVSTRLTSPNFQGDMGRMTLSPVEAQPGPGMFRSFPQQARPGTMQPDPVSDNGSSSRQAILDRLNNLQTGASGRRNEVNNDTKQKRRRNKASRRLRRSTGPEFPADGQADSARFGLTSRRGRVRRMAVDRYVVEVFAVCDFLCYEGFQRQNGVTDETATKNAILQFFQLVQEAMKTAYGGIETQHRQLGLSIDARIVGLYIATSARDKIIGNYVIGNSREIDTSPSLFEFALWVQDNMKVPLRADHYALVTGYDLAGESRNVIGQVTRVPSVCAVDGVSLNELLFRYVTITIVHELGHSLGALHDSNTNNMCRDRDGYVMAASANENSSGSRNAGQFSVCSAMFFKDALRRVGFCLKRNDFAGQGLPLSSSTRGRAATMLGLTSSVTSQDQQCGLFLRGSSLCREVYQNGAWDALCAARACRASSGTGAARNQGACFVTGPSLDFTSCGDRKWCQNGVCVSNGRAQQRTEDCAAGDSERQGCESKKCSSYDYVTRFVDCCETCKPIRRERFVTRRF